MSVKTVAALVGSLSLSTLATGCATVQPKPAAATHEKSGDFGCGIIDPMSAQKAKSADGAAPASSSPKDGEHACGSSGCGAKHD
jgi:hypothetical protein